MGRYSNFHGETTITFSFSRKHEDFKSKRIRFVKGRQASRTLYAFFINYATLKNFFLKNGKKVTRAPFTNSSKHVLNIYANSVRSSTLSKTPLRRVSSTKINIQVS